MRSRVLRYIRERGLMRAGDRVGVAVSGGADSAALLRVLLELRAELGIVLLVAHFNHGLRGEASDADQAFVAELAAQHELELFARGGKVREHAGQNKLTLEAAARELRYRWLISLAESRRLNVIATGHTLDDQAETVLLKFLRGAGTRGLAGIYPEIVAGAEAPGPLQVAERGPEGPRYQEGAPRVACARIVRPLLSVSRDEVEAYLAGMGQTWREDESNLDHRYARNRVRHELLPLLERDYNPNIRQILSDTAEVARAEEEYWEALARDELATRRRPEQVPQELKPSGLPGDNGTARIVPLPPEFLQTASEEDTLNLAGFAQMPLALQRRVLRRFAETENLALDFGHVENLLRCGGGEVPGIELPGGWLAVRKGACLRLRPPQPESLCAGYLHRLPIPGEVHVPEIGATLRAVLVKPEFAGEAEPGTLLNAALLGPELTVRNRQPGDRFWPAHRGSEEKLKRLFSEEHIPAERRPTWPVLLRGAEIVWVRAFPVAHAFAWTGSGQAMAIEVIESLDD